MGGRAVSEYPRLVSLRREAGGSERELSELKGAWASAGVRELAKGVEQLVSFAFVLVYSKVKD